MYNRPMDPYQNGCFVLLMVQKSCVHQLVGSLSHCLPRFIQISRWCGISSINSRSQKCFFENILHSTDVRIDMFFCHFQWPNSAAWQSRKQSDFFQWRIRIPNKKAGYEGGMCTLKSYDVLRQSCQILHILRRSDVFSKYGLYSTNPEQLTEQKCNRLPEDTVTMFHYISGPRSKNYGENSQVQGYVKCWVYYHPKMLYPRKCRLCFLEVSTNLPTLKKKQLKIWDKKSPHWREALTWPLGEWRDKKRERSNPRPRRLLEWTTVDGKKSGWPLGMGKNPAHHLGRIKPYRKWDLLGIDWWRISSINSMHPSGVV